MTNEFELRGMLATLKCWHRLTRAEEDDLLRFAAAQQEQEPVAWMNPSWIEPDTRGWQSDSFESIPIEGWLPIYTTPPQRTWVGLTDDEILDVNMSTVTKVIDDPIVCDTDHNIIQLGKAIEAKLKEKNT